MPGCEPNIPCGPRRIDHCTAMPPTEPNLDDTIKLLRGDRTVTSTVPKRDDYEVGYKKPPKATQFAKGHSGNPRGRSPRAKNTAVLFNEVFDETISLNENGR